MIDCAEAVRQMWDYVEHELDDDNRVRVEAHLALCRQCCGELEFAEELRRFLARRTELTLPADVAARFERMLAAIDPEGAR